MVSLGLSLTQLYHLVSLRHEKTVACFVYKQILIMPIFQNAEISLDVAEKGSEIKNTWMAEGFMRGISQEYRGWNHMG